MTKIKICGLSRQCDIEYANILHPDYVGFVFAPESRRYVTPEKAIILSHNLNTDIVPVGVFVNAPIEIICNLINQNIIKAVQLHGNEDETFIKKLRTKCNCTIIKAFAIRNSADITAAKASTADYVLLDSGSGSGVPFNWNFLKTFDRPYFLAGGLTPENVTNAILRFHPYGVDVSSSLETDGSKDKEKMTAFLDAVRKRGI